MTQAQIDAKFPIQSFQLAMEKSPLNKAGELQPPPHLHEKQEHKVQTPESGSTQHYDEIPMCKTESYTGDEFDEKSDMKETPAAPSKRRSLLRPFSLCSRHSNPSPTPAKSAWYPQAGDLGESQESFEKGPDLEAQEGASAVIAAPARNSLAQMHRYSLQKPPALTHASLAVSEDTDTDTESEAEGPGGTGAVMYSGSGNDGTLNTCAICIDDMESTTLVRGLSCGHIFHPECIDPWLLEKQARCPLCKRSFYASKLDDPLGPEPVEVLEAQQEEAHRERRRERERERGVPEGPMRRLSRRLWGSRQQSEVEGSRTVITSNSRNRNQLQSQNETPLPPVPAVTAEADTGDVADALRR